MSLPASSYARFLCATLAIAALPPSANAGTIGDAATATGGRGMVNIQSARTYGQGMVVFGLKAMSLDKRVRIMTAPGKYRYATDRPLVTALPFTLGLTNEIDLSVSLFRWHDGRPLLDRRDVALGYGAPEDGAGATYAGVKIRLPFSEKSRFQMAGRIGAFFDTSREELDGFNYFWTRQGTTIESSIYETFDIAPFLSLHLEQGYVISASNIYDDEVVGAAGLQARLGSRLSLGVELTNRTFLGVSPQSAPYAEQHSWSYRTPNGPDAARLSILRDSAMDMLRDYLVVSPSASIRVSRFLTLDAGVNINIANQASPKEKFQYVAGLTIGGDVRSWFDSDHDGVPNDIDVEIHTPHGYPVDRNGAALDTDGDGVPDGRDRQRDTPRGAKVDADGVGIDSDGDGVYDGLDIEPETHRGAPVDRFGAALDDDHDGVPNDRDREPKTRPGAVVDLYGVSLDTDGDGVPNGIDVEQATPKGARVDATGASLDTDGDGVPDGIDEEPGTPMDVLVDKKGRALVKQEISLLNEGVIRLNSLNYGPSSTALNPDMTETLDEIGRLLLKYPTLLIQIEGHTDDSGKTEINYRLSRERAKIALDYLLKRFPSLGRERFRAVGYGPDKPLVSNATPEGRRMNRRVDFVVINRGELLKLNTNN